MGHSPAFYIPFDHLYTHLLLLAIAFWIFTLACKYLSTDITCFFFSLNTGNLRHYWNYKSTQESFSLSTTILFSALVFNLNFGHFFMNNLHGLYVICISFVNVIDIGWSLCCYNLFVFITFSNQFEWYTSSFY